MRGTTLAIGMLLVGAAAGAGFVWFALGRAAASPVTMPASEAGEAEASVTEASPALGVNAAGEAVVRLDADVQRRVGLLTVALKGATRRPDVTAYGLLQEDPSQSCTLRAPVAGILRAADTTAWPQLHTPVRVGDLVGVVVPRLTPMEQIDLAARLAQARADASEAEAALAAARSSYEHKLALNAQSKAVSDRALEEAQTAVQTQEARLRAAQRIVELVAAAQAGAATAEATFELRAPLAGEVVEVLSQPGEAVEPGQPLLRTASFDTLIARVELPVGVTFDTDAQTADIEQVGADDQVLLGERIGLGAALDLTAHGTTLLYRISNPGGSLRPGAPVVARIPAVGGERSGVLIPRAAVIRLFGRMWVYVADAEGAFVRRQLVDAERVDEAWFAAQAFAPGDRVVTDGAQVLLSEELKAQIEREEAASE